jgi:hypothetical protein
MIRMTKKPLLAAAVFAVALLAFGAATAGAHGGRGPGGHGGPGGPGGASVSTLVTEAAKQLGVSRTTLATAITNAGVARVDEAVADEDIDADDAADLKQEAQDNLNVAYSLSRPAKVASNLGITTEKLNDAFKDARRALALARIDKALAAGDITAEQAADLKADVADANLPGYKPTRGIGIGGFGGKAGLGGPAGLSGPMVFGPRHR